MSNDPNEPAKLSAEERALVVERKAACPFIGSAVAEGHLPVLNSARDPLASVEKVRNLGNKGGGNLGEVLMLFANGNHLFMRGDSGRLDRRVPEGLFSLDFPGSQGSHPGHSGILEDEPKMLDSGRLSEADFARLTSLAKDGWIKRSDVGRFIARNVHEDENARVLDKSTALLLASDFGEVLKTGFRALLGRLFGSRKDSGATHRDVQQKFAKLTGDDNIVGSAGEFGLLFAFLANRPGAREIDGKPAVSVQDLKEMFIDKHLPDGWENWKKTRLDWIKNTNGLIESAREEYRALTRDK
ncbi:MAG TPA: hypothetical protein VKB12_18305 [Pyrinomonadaceae bacterium]|nr:hypothetical protein [Pyrinomonadaceae bacterium]